MHIVFEGRPLGWQETMRNLYEDEPAYGAKKGFWRRLFR
jgi:hypothetical protein